MRIMRWLMRVLSYLCSLFRALRREQIISVVRLEAYCAHCGGMTMNYDLNRQRIFCPDCD